MNKIKQELFIEKQIKAAIEQSTATKQFATVTVENCDIEKMLEEQCCDFCEIDETETSRVYDVWSIEPAPEWRMTLTIQK